MAAFLVFHWVSRLSTVYDTAPLSMMPSFASCLTNSIASMLTSVTQSGLPSASNRPPPLLIIMATMVWAPKLLPAPDPVAKPETPIFFSAWPAVNSSSHVVGTLAPT